MFGLDDEEMMDKFFATGHGCANWERDGSGGYYRQFLEDFAIR